MPTDARRARFAAPTRPPPPPRRFGAPPLSPGGSAPPHVPGGLAPTIKSKVVLLRVGGRTAEEKVHPPARLITVREDCDAFGRRLAQSASVSLEHPRK